jgi:2,4-dienoyl-CoA reductase-like NADH-dependent reductase (Old Yellow Enzyme family)
LAVLKSKGDEEPMPKLFDPLKVGNLTLKNRIVMPPMANDLADAQGRATDPLIAHYARRAPGVGLVIVEHSYCTPGGKASLKQLGIHDDAMINGLTKLAESVHAKGAPVCIQVNHAGREGSRAVSGVEPVAPSAIPSDGSGVIPRELERHEIRDLVRLFGEAARRAQRAGFDAVEVHGAHGYLLNQFTSPLTNRRSDEYGGSFEGRIRFPLEAVTEVRRVVGSDFLILYRLGASDGEGRGVTIGEMQTFAQRLVQAGVKIVDVSGGLIGDAPDDMTGQGYFLPLAEKIKQAVEAPVIGVGGITDPAFADQAIREGRVDLVAVGRALLADPDWALSAKRTLDMKPHNGS